VTNNELQLNGLGQQQYNSTYLKTSINRLCGIYIPE